MCEPPNLWKIGMQKICRNPPNTACGGMSVHWSCWLFYNCSHNRNRQRHCQQSLRGWGRPSPPPSIKVSHRFTWHMPTVGYLQGASKQHDWWLRMLTDSPVSEILFRHVTTFTTLGAQEECNHPHSKCLHHTRNITLWSDPGMKHQGESEEQRPCWHTLSFSGASMHTVLSTEGDTSWPMTRRQATNHRHTRGKSSHPWCPTCLRHLLYRMIKGETAPSEC